MKSQTVIALLPLNLKANTNKVNFFHRSTSVPNEIKPKKKNQSAPRKWKTEHLLNIIATELSVLKNGVPIPSETEVGKFEIVHFVLYGVVADGVALPSLINHAKLKGYGGIFYAHENLSINSDYIGGKTNCLLKSRRMISNSVCKKILFIFNLVCFVFHNPMAINKFIVIS